MNPQIRVHYKNWKGEERTREIIPQSIRFGATQWHPKDGWLLVAADTEDGLTKEFALGDCNFSTRPTDLLDRWQAVWDYEGALSTEGQEAGRVAYLMKLHSIVAPRCKKNTVGTAVVSDWDRFSATLEEREQAIESLKT